MADPYNPYSSYSTPTPGGVGHYPPDGHSQYPAYGNQQHGNTEPYQNPRSEGYSPGPEAYQSPPDPNHVYAPQPNAYHLAPEPYAPAQERSYTPTGHPDYPVPVTPTGYEHGQVRVPENAGYYNDHPADQPRYTPSASPHPPAVYISEPEDAQHAAREHRSDTDTETDRGMDRGLGGSLAGGVAGYYLGHKKEHGLLGAIGGALLGNFLEDKVKDHKKRDDDGGHHHRRKHHHHRHRSHSRHSDQSGHSHGSVVMMDALMAHMTDILTVFMADTLVTVTIGIAVIRGTVVRMITELK
ncbi:uncharacterized protein N7515_006708 [Penicillium bovifimosum]|uniref:Glycine zipper 2TM domain-containing protein n=1 Tax=Penicillium bovifimosum TaxID=126998 RepID=A0A9W9L107_9EURO|nr:uncharacterized protein N7515_006708 [Penicillium bovifimosum]KAJ5130669.1 hypothetical protein N7515_006708 [Penicillium bovifimosum]